jgi:hypothetical protein
MDQIVAQALTTYGKIAGMKRLEATQLGNGKSNGNGNSNGRQSHVDPVEISGLAMTAANH